MAEQHDDRSPMVKAMEWSARISSLSLELIVPACIGYWLDQRWGTGPLCVIIGAVLGFLTWFLSLLRLAQSSERDRQPRGDETSADADAKDARHK